MNIFSVAAVAVCISVLALSVKTIRPEMGQLITIAAVIFIAASLLPYVLRIVSAMEEFAAYGKGGGQYIKPVIKITGIAYISQIASSLCEDCGEKTLAGRVENAGKIAICTVALPIAREAFIKIIGIL